MLWEPVLVYATSAVSQSWLRRREFFVSFSMSIGKHKVRASRTARYQLEDGRD